MGFDPILITQIPVFLQITYLVFLSLFSKPKREIFNIQRILRGHRTDKSWLRKKHPVARE